MNDAAVLAGCRDTAFSRNSEGWPKVVRTVGAIAADGSKPRP